MRGEAFYQLLFHFGSASEAKPEKYLESGDEENISLLILNQTSRQQFLSCHITTKPLKK
jgi:hypothetical protein